MLHHQLIAPDFIEAVIIRVEIARDVVVSAVDLVHPASPIILRPEDDQERGLASPSPPSSAHTFAKALSPWSLRRVFYHGGTTFKVP